MDDTDLQVLSSPGSLSESEIAIVLKSQEDYRSLLRENQRLEKLLEEGGGQQRLDWILLLIGVGIGTLIGFLCAIPLSNFAYRSGLDEGMRWKQDLCQIKHPRSASAYQHCINQ